MADEQSKVGFGPQFIGNPTPMWAKWLFRGFFYITSTITVGLGIFTHVDPGIKLQISQWVLFSNMAVHGFLKNFGIKVEDTDYYADQNKPKP